MPKFLHADDNEDDDDDVTDDGNDETKAKAIPQVFSEKQRS